VRPAPQTLVSQEGQIEDDTGRVAFTVWKDVGVKPLQLESDYIFYRVGLGTRDGETEVRVTKGSGIFPLKSRTHADGILLKLSLREKTARTQLARSASTEGLFSGKRGFYSTVITLALVFWAVLLGLHFGGVLSEKQAREILEKVGLISPVETGLIKCFGKVEKVIDACTIQVNSQGKKWIVHYEGIAAPPLEADKLGRFKPLALRSRNYNRYLVADKQVRFEFSAPKPDILEVQGYVFLGDRMVNAAMLSKGYAWLVDRKEDTRYNDKMLAAEEGARIKKLGIWREKLKK